MESKTTKTVKVPDARAEEWDTYVEQNPEVDSVSHLIRLSVQRQMSGKYDRRQRRSDDGDAAESGEVKTALRQIQTAIGDVEERLSALEGIKTAEANYDLRKAVWSFLPEEPEEVIDDEIPPVYGDGDDGLDSLDVLTPEQIAQKLGADVADVQDALDELVESTGQVKCSDTNFDGNHYWKKGT